jgi:hypothetical protein
MERSYLTIRCDVTELTERQRGSLAGHLVAQTEALDEGDADDYPGVEYEIEWDGPPAGTFTAEPRTVLCHLNVTVPATDSRDAGQIAQAIEAALVVGIEGGPDEIVGGLEVCVPLAEEV